MAENKTIVQALAAAMAEVQAVGKEQRNNDQNYNFRGVDAVVNAVGPVFRKHGIIPIPHKSEAHYRDVQTSRGKPSRECTVSVTYRFYGPAGDFLEAEVPGESMDFSDKGTAKAMSVAYRIVLLQSLCIPTDDADPDAHSYERSGSSYDEPTHERVTDWDWANGFEKRVDAADSESVLKGLYEELKHKYDRWQLADDDSQRLVQLIAMRKNELGGAPQ